MISLESVLKTKMEYKGSYIGSRWIRSKQVSGSFIVQSPANLDWKLESVDFSFQEIEECVENAREAYKSWRRVSLHNRIEILNRFGDELLKRKDLIGRLIAIETGKPLEEALGEAALLKSKITVTIEEGLKLIAGQTLDLGPNMGRGEIHWKPKGVLAVIGPFNFPVHLSNGHIIPALLTGNTVILKPSEKTPYCAQVYMEAAQAAGFAPGILQLLQGDADLATRLIRHPYIDGVLATCSYEVGIKIQKSLAESPEKVLALEMGGKNAALVWEGTPLEKVADDIVRSAFLTTGQRCTALSRIYVQRAKSAELIKLVHEKTKQLIISHPFQEDPKPFMGPLISARSQEDFLRSNHIAESEGAETIMRPKILEGTPQMSRNPLPQGYYVTPSIHSVEKPNLKSHYQNQEIFGPDIFFCPVDSLEEGIDAVNLSKYGLAFSFFGGDETLFKQVADEVEVGCCYWNRPTIGASARLPFGGWKRSGNQRAAGIFAIYASNQVQARIL